MAETASTRAKQPLDARLALAPALAPYNALPGSRLPHRATRKRRAYTEPERIQALIVVAAVGPQAASDTLAVPIGTLKSWWTRAGGLAGLRAAVHTALGATQYALALRMVNVLASKLDEMTPQQLVDAIQALGIGAAAHGVGSDDDEPVATAQVVVMVGGEAIPIAVKPDSPSSLPADDAVEVQFSPAGSAAEG